MQHINSYHNPGFFLSIALPHKRTQTHNTHTHIRINTHTHKHTHTHTHEQIVGCLFLPLTSKCAHTHTTRTCAHRKRERKRQMERPPSARPSRHHIPTITHTNTHTHTCVHICAYAHWTSHIAHMDEFCHTCRWVMSCTWMGHAAHTRFIDMYDLNHSFVRHVLMISLTCLNYTWLTWMGYITYMNGLHWHASIIRDLREWVTWHIWHM